MDEDVTSSCCCDSDDGIDSYAGSIDTFDTYDRYDTDDVEFATFEPIDGGDDPTEAATTDVPAVVEAAPVTIAAAPPGVVDLPAPVVLDAPAPGGVFTAGNPVATSATTAEMQNAAAITRIQMQQLYNGMSRVQAATSPISGGGPWI